jgi:GT2 family glycosyltransferase
MRNLETERLAGWRTPPDPALHGRALADCCLLIATYQRPTEVVKLLSALLTLPDPPAEVVIVDGTPGEVVESRILEWTNAHPALPFELRFVKSKPGLTRQRNVAIDASSREFCFFLDDDAIPEPGYFCEIRRVFVEENSSSGKRIGAVCGYVDNEMNLPGPWRWRFRLATGLVRNLGPMMYDPAGTGIPRNFMKPFRGVKPVQVMHGLSMNFRRQALEQHRFSRFFEGYSYGEDVDISLRVGQDWAVVCAGDAHVNHYPAAGGRPNQLKKGRMEIVNRFFIWSRATRSTASFGDHARFWLDVAFVFAMNIGWFLRAPGADGKRDALDHMRGYLGGVWQCWTDPPRCEDPAPRRENEVAWRALERTAACSS